jgi:perosamine synthetase
MHEQPVFRKMGFFESARCPVAERIGRQGFYLPSGLALTDQQIAEVAEAMTEVLG